VTSVLVTQGNSPLVLGMPHIGTDVPPGIFTRLNPLGQMLADTDWHIDLLYDGLLGDVTIVKATFHRYVIDANRPPDGESLYPGQNTTGLVPLTDFDGHPIWADPPSPDEIEMRRKSFHAPYHVALEAEMARVRSLHGHAILWDCHSIRSVIPFLFEGSLPDLNIGTNGGASCHPDLATIASKTSRYSQVVNGRFKGGWTTRHYGCPDEGWHAIQMEIAQSTYLAQEAAPWTYDAGKAGPLRARLAEMLAELSDWRPT
jgi:N-formylglutamate deformylase